MLQQETRHRESMNLITKETIDSNTNQHCTSLNRQDAATTITPPTADTFRQNNCKYFEVYCIDMWRDLILTFDFRLPWGMELWVCSTVGWILLGYGILYEGGNKTGFSEDYSYHWCYTENEAPHLRTKNIACFCLVKFIILSWSDTIKLFVTAWCMFFAFSGGTRKGSSAASGLALFLLVRSRIFDLQGWGHIAGIGLSCVLSWTHLWCVVVWRCLLSRSLGRLAVVPVTPMRRTPGSVPVPCPPANSKHSC